MDFQDIYRIKDEIRQIQAVYEVFDEDARLRDSRAAQVEFLTTVRIVGEYVKPGMRILDVGAGTGIYSLYFARRGCKVSALELSPRNVETFRRNMTEEDCIDLRQGNAVDLSPWEDRSFDAVLLFGPLYHLHREEDRQRCIAEARRVLRPGGKLFFSFICNDMVILTEFGYDPGYFAHGAYDKETFKVEDFPFVFHTVEDCRRMLRAGGVRILREAASDGVSELLAERINAMDEESYAQYLRYHAYVCEKPEMLGMSNHLLFVGE